MRPLAILQNPPAAKAPGPLELIVDEAHHEQVVVQQLLQAQTSIEIATADLKAMLVPTPGTPGSSSRHRRAPSVLQRLATLAARGVEIRLLHAGVPSAEALRVLKKLSPLPPGLQLRRCPRLHAKTVVVDSAGAYLGSANLTGAGLGAKHPDKRNIEWGVWLRDASAIDAVLDQFNRLWEGDRCITCRRRDVCPVPLEPPSL
jgi:phosphatidylserine/phosphatidylglycerophosphate/cardiolipin synthase-like enzyme